MEPEQKITLSKINLMQKRGLMKGLEMSLHSNGASIKTKLLYLRKQRKRNNCNFLSTFSNSSIFLRFLSNQTYCNRGIAKTDVPGKRATDLIDVGVAEYAPEAISRGVFGAEKARVSEEELEIREFGLEAREEGGERFGVVREVLVATALIVTEPAYLAELESIVALLILLRRLILAVALILRFVSHGVFRVRARFSPSLSERLVLELSSSATRFSS